MLLFWLTSLVALAPADADSCREHAFYVMGTVATLEACGLEEPELDRAITLAYGEIEAVDELMSLYRPDTELTRINRASNDTRVPVSQPTFVVLEEALRIASLSQGAFDPTVGPLMRTWGLDRGKPAIPEARKLDATRARVGFRYVRLEERTATVSRTRPGVEIDLGGIAKGYAVDRALTVLEAAGVTRAVVDLGESSVCVFDRGDSAVFFRLRHASLPSTAFRIVDGCVSTSGADQQGFEVDGEWLSHIIDPRTGWPVRGSISATVVGETGRAMEVDALSTAGFVAGPDGAVDLWQRFGVEGILYYRGAGEIRVVRTPGFPEANSAR